MNDNLHQLRCCGCGDRIRGSEAQPDFRCIRCGDLFEVEYPGWAQRSSHDRPNPGALKWLWRERRCNTELLDQSGVWRFRELLPMLDNFGNAVTLREGNTPLYALPRAAKALGIDQLFVVDVLTQAVTVVSTDPLLDWPSNIAFGRTTLLGKNVMYLANYGMMLGNGTTIVRVPTNHRGANLIR